MKKRIITIIMSVILIASAMSMAACTGGDVYSDLAEDGFTVKVRYDAGGAVVNETQNVTIVEVFNKDDIVTKNGKSGIKLLAPDDSRRGEGVFKLAKADNDNNYFSPGWYRERTLRVNEKGEALDAYGELVSVSGREQGYVYSGRWDFENDLLDPSTLENGELTLYAAWIPFYTYEIYAENESGELELINSVKKLDMNFPVWNERTGKIDMKDMPKVKGKTFYEAFSDEDMTSVLTGSIDGDNTYVDLEKGIGTETVVKIYTKWMEGDWLRIFDAEKLADEVEDDMSGNFILGADLDFTDVEWPEEILTGEFNGKIVGDGFVIKNIALKNGEYATAPDQLFGSVGENASLDVSVESFDAE